ncbi:hypothetical protein [Haloterrigena alkaliphila]|uniref:Uncharacterized protein n=1 Tax=Haloterrigena alkaliphila TaxID=2816475 RepID=A0A8A2VGP7_9EURY|nr:hypothetical protein [Haloterrigena alkaliphila]QSX01240.1 hypothetical protein J0X25_14130 [Haloterrigena alkaliphila]
MTCPHLEYRDESDGTRFDEARAYCTAADRFVQPMRADVCNDRYDHAHDRHCEIYLEHADSDGAGRSDDEAVNAGAGSGGRTESEVDDGGER